MKKNTGENGKKSTKLKPEIMPKINFLRKG
jgi:hypothetical protein